MFKKVMILICLSQPSNLVMAESMPIEYEEVKNICSELMPDEFKRDSGGFPFVVDKESIVIDSKSCDIKANIRFYDFTSDSMAKDKFNELVASKRSAGIELEPESATGTEYIWQLNNRKYARIGIKNNIIFDVVINAKSDYFSRLVDLVKIKYGSL